VFARSHFDLAVWRGCRAVVYTCFLDSERLNHVCGVGGGGPIPVFHFEEVLLKYVVGARLKWPVFVAHRRVFEWLVWGGASGVCPKLGRWGCPRGARMGWLAPTLNTGRGFLQIWARSGS